tara:strand:+ start:249 stop:386 length:138 start_codon:yes stop_codon:yes gene_type:complete
MFGVEMAAGRLAQSQALQADVLDFLVIRLTGQRGGNGGDRPRHTS